MRLILILLPLFESITIAGVYVDDPKKAIHENWESIHFIVHQNQVKKYNLWNKTDSILRDKYFSTVRVGVS